MHSGLKLVRKIHNCQIYEIISLDTSLFNFVFLRLTPEIYSASLKIYFSGETVYFRKTAYLFQNTEWRWDKLKTK